MKMTFLKLFFFLLGILMLQNVIAQQSVMGPVSPAGVSELIIPASPIFDLMGVTPSQVVHYSEIKNFKVDWSFRNWRINPNISLQAQPIWELVYKNKNISYYQRASRLMRSLSSLDLSIGSVAGENSLRKFGGSVKVNLYTQKDPLLVKNAYRDIENNFESQKLTLKSKSNELVKKINTITNPDTIEALKDELTEVQFLLNTLGDRKKEEIILKAQKYISENWNSAYLDFAVGWIRSYTTDSVGSFKTLDFGRNSGTAVWLNGGIGIGKRGMIIGLFRGLFFKEGINFKVQNKITNDIITQRINILNQLISVGVNCRLGGPKFNFFTECFVNARLDNKPEKSIGNNILMNTDLRLIDNSASWVENSDPFSISIGGDWRTSRNVIINFGIRTIFNEAWQVISFTPVATIGCIMR